MEVVTCSGWCLPLYVYIVIAILNTVAPLIWGPKGFGTRLWNAGSNSLWSVLYGVVVYLLCRNCQQPAAYLALIPASVWFGFQMFLLLLRQPKTMVVTSEK